jgi:hypothetical protein
MAKGNIISLMDGLYTYELPPEPRDEKTILNYNVPKRDQVWKREEFKDVKKMALRERVEYIERMDDYFWNGRWMFINGELVWITGMHWDFLQVNKWDFGYAQYLKQQRFDFYFRDLVRKDPNCYGEAVLKCRRCGFTTQELEEAIYTLIEDENSNVAFQSSEKTKCIRTLLHPMIQAFLSRPAWMRPKFYAPNGKKPRNSLELISNRVSILDGPGDDEYMGGTALAYPTVASAIDGYKKRLVVMDEVFKWEDVSPIETLGINKKCVVEYGIKGKVHALSTMGDNDAVIQAVKEGCKIIYDSNPRVRDQNNRTTSGLYEWFVSAIHSADIPEEYRDSAYTKYGDINKDKAEAYVRGEVNKHPAGSKERVFEMRRLPLEKKHGLMAATSNSHFPELRMQDRLDILNQLPTHKKPYVRGNLSHPDMKGKVHFTPDELGIWLIAVHPYFSVERDIDTRNRWRESNGKFKPPKNPEYVIGYDPIKAKKKNTSSNNLSLACIKVWKKFNYFGAVDENGNEIVNEYCALMLHRPEDPKDAHFEAVKACRYFGAPINVERNVADTDDVFIEHGMEDFLLKDAKGIYGMVTTDKTTSNGILRLMAKFAAPKTEEDKDQIACYPFEDGLIDFMNFEMGDSLKSHVTMATIMVEYGADQIIQTSDSDDSVRRMVKAAQSIFPKIN